MCATSAGVLQARLAPVASRRHVSRSAAAGRVRKGVLQQPAGEEGGQGVKACSAGRSRQHTCAHVAGSAGLAAATGNQGIDARTIEQPYAQRVQHSADTPAAPGVRDLGAEQRGNAAPGAGESPCACSSNWRIQIAEEKVCRKAHAQQQQQHHHRQAACRSRSAPPLRRRVPVPPTLAAACALSIARPQAAALTGLAVKRAALLRAEPVLRLPSGCWLACCPLGAGRRCRRQRLPRILRSRPTQVAACGAAPTAAQWRHNGLLLWHRHRWHHRCAGGSHRCERLSRPV